jgi:hypothetical protein
MSEQEPSTIPPFFNRLMSGVLRSPLHGIASRSVMLITFTGRKSGKTYTTPISYLREGDMVTAFSHARWTKNLAGGAPVTLHIKNKEYHGQGDLVADNKEAVASELQRFLNIVRSDARFYQVKFDEDGTPNWEDVQRAAQNSTLLKIQINGRES